MRRKRRSYANSIVLTVRGLALLGFVVGTVAAVLSITPGLLAQSATCSAGMQEAESGILYGFSTGSDAAASGGEFVHVPDGDGSRWEPSAAYRAEFCFDVFKAGDYVIEGGVWADGGTNDSFFVAVNGTMIGDGRWDIAHHSDYSGDMVNTYRVTDPTVFLARARAAHDRRIPA